MSDSVVSEGDDDVAAAVLPLALHNPLECDKSSDAPLVFLLKQLYAKPRFLSLQQLVASSGSGGAGDGAAVVSQIQAPDLPRATFSEFAVFSYAHESRLLCEPFVNAAGKSTRACVMGAACMGKNPSLVGHHESRGGIVITETMSPAELVAFEATGDHPTERRCCILCTRYNVHAGYLFARKQRGFPAWLILNCYTNMFGDGEYDAQYALPLVGDTIWHGVAGSVLGLHLNALQLAQTAEKSWFVDQSALKHTNLAVNQMYRPLYCFAHQDPRVFLQHHFKHRVQLSDAQLLFADFEVLNAQRPKLPSLERSDFLAWPEEATKSFVHRLIYYRVNRLNELLQQCGNYYGNRFSLLLTVYIDGHIPMAEMLLRGVKVTSFVLRYSAYEDTLPDFGVQLTNAAMCITTPAFQTKKDMKKSGTSAQVQLTQALIKLLPEYSSPKQFHSLLVRCLANTTLAKPMWSILQCALLGNFDCSRERLPYAQRFELLRHLNDENACEFIKKLVDDEHLAFFAFREYLQVVANNIPALKAMIDATAPLSQQTDRIRDALRVMRQNASADWRVAFEPGTLEMLKRVYKRAPKRKTIPRGSIDVSGSLVVMTQRTIQRRSLKREHGVAFDVGTFEAVHKSACRWLSLDDFAGAEAALATTAAAAGGGAGAAGDGGGPAGVLSEVNRSSRAVLAALERAPFKRPASFFDEQTISNAALRVLSDSAVALDTALSTVLIDLPPAFLAIQVAAVARRFQCDASDWNSISKATQIRYCPCCQEVKNFVLVEDERGETQRNTRSAGFKKLQLDVDTGRLTCALNSACCRFSLITHDCIVKREDGALRGGILVTRQGAYMVSPCCGFLCLAASIKANPTGFDCPACCQSKLNVAINAPDLRLCGYCSKRIQSKISQENVVLLRSENRAVLKYSFCKTHFRTWARTRNGYLDFDFVSRNMTNRNGSGLILNPT